MATANPILHEPRLAVPDEHVPMPALDSLKQLFGETLDVLHAALLPGARDDEGLDEHLRRDLGLR